MTEVFLRRLSRWQADQQREAIADLYVAAYRGASGEEFHDRRVFLKRFAADVQRPGFDMLVASETSLAGCVYGYPPHRSGGWWQGLRGGVPQEIEELTASGNVFAVAELMVHPSHRRHHIASHLQERLLARVEAELVTTFVDATNTAATAAYRSWGWSMTGRITATEDRPELEVWSREPLRGTGAGPGRG
ncbi:GNAT family N-acetyltransferase [Streptomyces sp. H27-C3]|uniref:GNAT family N-acetyltransferase n=1 Tax=Streptomyces sp. H27-C3 TaxID=3046305 RepID=UPI0024BB94D9|nr:GNAT family N-acetyltransferase [Streptomyces sp. H27-C3]MDJ0461631.1 GNAT family N-acetyltransferase [Streptomyces sp. H27-C3]